MQFTKSLKTINNEKGMVLVVVVLIMAVLVLLGSTAIMSTSTDMKISGNYKVGSQAFYIADAGIERARDVLRSSYVGSTTLTTMLVARTGSNGALSNSANITNFHSNGNFVTDDIPLIPDTTSGSGTYRVYVTNDPSEGITNTADANRTLTLTSFGRGPNNSFAVVQAVVKMILMPPPPGAIVLPGPDVNFLGSNSNASGVMGGPESAISLNSAAAQTTVEDYLGPSGINRINNYECDAGKGQVCINDDTATFPLEYSTVSGINGIVNTLTGSADVIYNNAGGATRTLTAADVGTTTNRKIVIVEGDAVLGPVNGAGILVVKGQLTLNGNFNYQGLILVVGEGNVLRNGGGNGTIEGSIVVANTNDATSNTVLGEPTFDTSGGGNSDINYNPTQINPPGTRPFVKLSWKQILR